MVVPPNEWFRMENPIKMDISGYLSFMETPMWNYQKFDWLDTYQRLAAFVKQTQSKSVSDGVPLPAQLLVSKHLEAVP